MSTPVELWNLDPLLHVAAAGAVLALGPLAWMWLRHRRSGAAQRLQRLTLLTLFLTFDLVLFGAYTRLTDSGLGCPDWPGCYGQASPLGAHEAIAAEQAARPHGPVTHRKAWIEMIHRYLASAVGALIVVLALATARSAWRLRRSAGQPPADAFTLAAQWRWALLSLVWVIVQGLFGAWTVTLKLYPAIVTLHLLGGLGLLALLAVQAHAVRPAVPLPARTQAAVAAVAGLALVQITLGGWVSTNYAVLACADFPTCHGSWWPAGQDYASGFRLLRPLGQDGHGGLLGMDALVAIHMAHRVGALLLLAALPALAWGLWRQGPGHPARRWAAGLLGVALWQLATGMSNVVLGWPLPAAVAHTGGAALLVLLLASLMRRMRLQGCAGRAGSAGSVGNAGSFGSAMCPAPTPNPASASGVPVSRMLSP